MSEKIERAGQPDGGYVFFGPAGAAFVDEVNELAKREGAMSEKIELTDVRVVPTGDDPRYTHRAFARVGGREFFADIQATETLQADRAAFHLVVLSSLRAVHQHLTGRTMTEKIKPAIHENVWIEIARAGGAARYDPALDSSEQCAFNIALNNAALPDDDPRKTTREWVDHIRAVAHDLEAQYDNSESRELALFERFAFFALMADALESYLPPEKM